MANTVALSHVGTPKGKPSRNYNQYLNKKKMSYETFVLHFYNETKRVMDILNQLPSGTSQQFNTSVGKMMSAGSFFNNNDNQSTIENETNSLLEMSNLPPVDDNDDNEFFEKVQTLVAAKEKQDCKSKIIGLFLAGLIIHNKIENWFVKGSSSEEGLKLLKKRWFQEGTHITTYQNIWKAMRKERPPNEITAFNVFHFFYDLAGRRAAHFLEHFNYNALDLPQFLRGIPYYGKGDKNVTLQSFAEHIKNVLVQNGVNTEFKEVEIPKELTTKHVKQEENNRAIHFKYSPNLLDQDYHVTFDLNETKEMPKKLRAKAMLSTPLQDFLLA